MRIARLFLLCLPLALTAQIKIQQASDRISVDIDGKPFTELIMGPDVAKPFFHPLRAVSGTSVTRNLPLEAGDSKDHPQHRGLMFAHADLNGYNFWANESFNKGKKGKIVVRKIEQIRSGAKKGTIVGTFDWRDLNGATILTDTRTVTFYSHPTLRIVDFDIVAKAVQTAKFGDTHEGSFGLRVAAWLEEPAPKYIPHAESGESRPAEPQRTGLISNSEGRKTEAEVRGKRANWADYSGEYKGEKLGVAILDHPSNLKHPTWWHTRGYGIFAANIFGAGALSGDKSLDGSVTLQPGETLRFRYRVIIHPGSAAEANIDKLYTEYSRNHVAASE